MAGGKGRRAGQRFDAEHGVTTEGLIFLGDLDPQAVGAAIEFATHYEPTPVSDAERLIDALPLQPPRSTFVDLGAGMGRVVLLAAQRGYRNVVGVEISPALLEVARANVCALEAPAARRVRLVRSDAATFRLPRGDLALYLYNPFRAPVLEAVVASLLARPASGEVFVAYHTPLERAVIEASGAFALFADLGFGVIYRLSRPPSTALHPGSCDRR